MRARLSVTQAIEPSGAQVRLPDFDRNHCILLDTESKRSESSHNIWITCFADGDEMVEARAGIERVRWRNLKAGG
jgi:hypothetical protein